MEFIEDIQIFGMNMAFISSSEAKNAYFMRGVASRDKTNGIFSPANLSILFNVYNVKRG